jgi:peroxiredoxin
LKKAQRKEKTAQKRAGKNIIAAAAPDTFAPFSSRRKFPRRNHVWQDIHAGPCTKNESYRPSPCAF